MGWGNKHFIPTRFKKTPLIRHNFVNGTQKRLQQLNLPTKPEFCVHSCHQRLFFQFKNNVQLKRSSNLLPTVMPPLCAGEVTHDGGGTSVREGRVASRCFDGLGEFTFH